MGQTLNAKMRARMEEVRAQVAEQDDLIEVIAIALLTCKNVFYPGRYRQAKSYAVNLFCEGITGARLFERLISKQTDEEALFGCLVIPGGVPDEVLLRSAIRIYSGLDACLADREDTRTLVEEMEQYRKALSALNERRYTNEGTTIDIPTIFFFSTSNEIPNFSNPEEKILKPLYDRFELKVVTEYVEDRAARRIGKLRDEYLWR